MTKPTITLTTGRFGRRAALALALAALAATFAPERADAGLYTAVQCHPGYTAGSEDASYASTSRDYVPSAACARGGGGLQGGHRRSHTLSHRWGGWTITAPAGAELIRVAVRASGVAAGGLVPEVLAGPVAALRAFGQARGAPHRAAWKGSGSEVVARLRCAQPRSCAPRGEARLRIKRVRLRLRDLTRPTLGLAGSLLQPGARRGSLGLDATAGDGGGGVSQVSVEVNGVRVGTRSFACALVRNVAVRIAPCPAAASVTMPLDSAAAPFRQGRNEFRVCASDLATSGSANVTCETRTVRIDNACPISPVATGTHLTARVAGTRGRGIVARGGHPAVVGRLVDAGGDGVGGARVCVTTRVRAGGSLERVVATPSTNRDGSFRAPLPRGPSRSVRVAYWPNASGALERFARVRVRARPRLELHPRGRLRNGDRLRILARLPGPANDRRIVKVEARAAGRWVPVASGRTGSRGVYRTSYRFHATTRRRVYRFRALVPRQRGYPYAPGVSAVKRQVVRG